MRILRWLVGGTVSTRHDKEDIAERFAQRSQAERYRDRFKKGRHQRTHEKECIAVESLLASMGRLRVILDVGSGPGRFVPLFSRYADRVIQADYSRHMLEVSSADHPLQPD